MALSVAGSSHCRGGLRCVCVSARVHAPCWYKLALPLTLLSVFFFLFFSRKYKEGGKKASVLVPTVHLVKSEHTTPTRQRWAATVFAFLRQSTVDAAGGEMQVLAFTSPRTSLLPSLPPPPSVLRNADTYWSRKRSGKTKPQKNYLWQQKEIK